MKAVLEPNSLLSQRGAGSGSRILLLSLWKQTLLTRPRGFLPPRRLSGCARGARGSQPGPRSRRRWSHWYARHPQVLSSPADPFLEARIPPEPGDRVPLPSQRRAVGARALGAGRSKARRPFQEARVGGKLGTEPLGLGQAARDGCGLSSPVSRAPKLCGWRCRSGQNIPRGAHLLQSPSPAFPFPPQPLLLRRPGRPRFPGSGRQAAGRIVLSHVAASLGPQCVRLSA